MTAPLDPPTTLGDALPKCPRPELLNSVLQSWDSVNGMVLVWPPGKGRFPMRGELLQDTPGRGKVYAVTIGDALRCLAKMHDAWDEQELAKYRGPAEVTA